jgi:hypothetical protein
MLVIGMYKGACKRKGLGRRGNATTIYNRWGEGWEYNRTMGRVS